MLISPPCVVTLTWTLTDAQNAAIDTLDAPTEFLLGGDDLLPAIEDALTGQGPGFEARVQIEPEQAFGDYRPELVCFEPRSIFPPDLEVGLAFEGLPPGHQSTGMPADAIYLVTEIYPEHVVLDGNHPLAGMALRVALKVVDVRAATDEEVEARSVGASAVSVLRSRPADPTLH
jgi:FKBP-type peptidyl-prolyl cis-trans isomerase SlyD